MDKDLVNILAEEFKNADQQIVDYSDLVVADEPIVESSFSGMSSGISPQEVDSMKKMLEALSAVGQEAVSTVMERVNKEPLMEEYVSASITGNRIKHKNYEIRVREIESFNGTKKVYDIIESQTRELISDDLFLYEAAVGIVKYLNKGHNLLSNEVREIIALEQSYANLRTDAGIFRKRLQESISNKDSSKSLIYEARFNSAKDKALDIKKKLKKISDSIR